jgi:clan AA aspartic protease (TIGR02281 family)
LLYLKAQVKGSNVTMLLDTGATNSFMRPECAHRLGLEVEQTALPVKVNFAKGLCQAAGVVKEV